MASLNNVLKAIEALKATRESNTALSDPTTSIQRNLTSTGGKKEKLSYCTTIVEGICSPTLRVSTKFSQTLGLSIETLLMLCNDVDSDVRMIADECLNKIIRAMVDSSITKVQVELYNEIKRNGPARTLRAALWRFALLSHMIRPIKGKAYVSNLIPCIVLISERSEDSVIETLSQSLPLILKTLGPFMTDNDVKTLLRAFFRNVSSSQATFRRATANMIVTTCKNCRKPHVFFNYALNYLLDVIVPVSHDGERLSTVIGVFGCLRMILPHVLEPLESPADDAQRLDVLLQIYELCLHYAKFHSDHNLVNAALETLAQLLQSPPESLACILLSKEGITSSKIMLNEDTVRASLSQMSDSMVNINFEKDSNSALSLLESDVPDIGSKIKKLSAESMTELPVIPDCHPETEPMDNITNMKGNVLEDYTGLTIGTIDDECTEEGSEVGSEIERLDKSPYMSLQSEESKEECLEETVESIASPQKQSLEYIAQEINIGAYTNCDIPVKYCCRFLANSFLLTGNPGQLIPDKVFRVSVKSLALTCLGHLMQLHPDLLLMTLAKDVNPNENHQVIADIFLLADHPDPQIRGNVSMIIGHFLKSVFVQCGGSFKKLKRNGLHSKEDLYALLDRLIKLLAKGLEDESASTCRQTLLALNICLPELLESEDSKYSIPLLKILPKLVKNSYFLVKVNLLELLSKLSYVTIDHVTCGSFFQGYFIDAIIALLGDQDQRVRRATCDAIIRSIPSLYFQRPNEDAITRKASQYTEEYLSTVKMNLTGSNFHYNRNKFSLNSSVKPFSLLNANTEIEYCEDIEDSLSRMISMLTEMLMIRSSKYLIYGCCEALSRLSESYCTTVYPKAWECMSSKPTLKKSQKKSSSSRSDGSEAIPASETLPPPASSGLLSLTLSLLSTSPVSLDLSTHRHLLLLAGNLASGTSVYNLKPNEPQSKHSGDISKLWCMFKDKQIGQYMELLLTHILRVLNIFVHVMEEVQLSQASAKSMLSALPSAQSLSPRKKSSSEQKAKDKTDRVGGLKFTKEQMGTFANAPHYTKMFDILKAAHSNYLVTLDSDASEMYLSLLNATLEVLSQILEIATINEAGRIAEEVLYYLQTTVILSPTASICCVQQLLKCLFGTNVSAQWNDMDVQKSERIAMTRDDVEGFYDRCFQKPARQIVDTIKILGNNCRGGNEPDTGWTGFSRRKSERKFSSSFKNLIRSSDQKTSVASFIRLFEPMVIKSLKQYTVTSSIELQSQVLMLLSQLVQLRVNYCLLDSEKIFIGFVLEQFQFIEEGHIQKTEELLPKMFRFLIDLSYEKNHSKAIIGVPKVIQLCDGLMASGQPPVTHCIPALIPVVRDIFLARNGSVNAAEQRELETTREVLISMLLRLIEYHQVVELLALCLTECKCSGDGNGEEKWRRWSRSTTDAILPMLTSGKLRLESHHAHISLVKLFAAVSPSVFRPVDPLLKVLFAVSVSLQDPILKLKRWLGMVNVVLLFLISCAKEEAMLARLLDLSAYMADPSNLFPLPSSPSHGIIDPLNALSTQTVHVPPERTLAKFIFNVIGLVGSKVHDMLGLVDRKVEDALLRSVAHYSVDDDYLAHQFALFLQQCIHMFESGSHCKVANAAMQMIQGRNVPDEDKLPINELNRLMLRIGKVRPMLTCQWAYLMTLLGYNEMSFWEKVLGVSNRGCIVYSGPSSVDTHDKHSGTSESKSSDRVRSINGEIVRRGGTILFCDYVCENLNDAEPLTWLLVNHIEKAVKLATESPVKDLLVVAVHRNPAASGLLVQAIATKCVDLSKPSFVKRLLQCMEGAHSSQSGTVIMTLIPRFLSTKYLVLSRMAAKIACRRVEILLTSTPEDVAEQLPKEDLTKIMDILQTTKLSKKHGALVGLLNKLGVQFYDLSPVELDHCRPFNPSTVKNIQLDRNWFLSQVKLRCCHPSTNYSTYESAQLLSNLELEDCSSILSSKEFNVKILKDCIRLGVRLSIEKCQRLEFGQARNEKDFDFEASPLYTAAKQCLLIHVQYVTELLPKPHQIFNPNLRNVIGKELKYSSRFSELIQDTTYRETLFSIIPAVNTYVSTLSSLSRYNLAKVDVKFDSDLSKFALLCIETTHWMIGSDENSGQLMPRNIELAFSCANEILKHPGPAKVFGDIKHYSWTCSAAATITALVQRLLRTTDPLPAVNVQALEPATRDEETKEFARACIRMASLIGWLEKCQIESSTEEIPRYLFVIIKGLIVSVSRQPLVNSFVLIPPLVWKHGWDIVGAGETKCHFPLLSSESNHLQEDDILKQFIYRVNTIGWTSRPQFEEIWMALLGVLNISQNENIPSEEVSALIKASSLAIRAITTLLLQTLLLPYPGNPSASNPIHLPRDPQLSVYKRNTQRLFAIQDLLTWKYEFVNGDRSKMEHVFNRGNIERAAVGDNFTYGQLSVAYLWSLCNLYEDKLSSSVFELKNRRNDALVSASLDLDSCLRFLIELYTTWMAPQADTPIQLLTEVVRSIIGISEIFVERAQYQWMLDVCLEVAKTHPTENQILHQYLVIAVCKAAAVLTPLNFEALDKVKHLVDVILKSGTLAARISALHGLLYLFQSAALAGCEETMNIMHPLAIEYIQKYIEVQDSNGVNFLDDSLANQCEEHQAIMWALVFFLLEHAEDAPPDTEAPAVLELVLSLVTSQNISSALHQTLLQGLERLVATRSVIGKVAEQVAKVAVERLKQPSPLMALPALQLLLTCMYTEAADRLNQPEVGGEPLPDVDPEVLVRSIERTSAIFDRIKRGHPMEVEVLCAVLSEVLGDFFPPSEILTKVIGEFLSPQQPHPRLLSAVVFKVCERACISTQMGLLQDWVVFSLPNFIQSLPAAMSTWCLSCFFISASTNTWLRALFPHVQSRIGKYEYEDKRILCIAASDFYHKLPKDTQKKAFVETFEAASKEPGTPFGEILASL